MGVSTFEPTEPGTALVRAQPRAGLLLRLAVQRGVGEPAVQWSRRHAPTFWEVLHASTERGDGDRGLDTSLRTHVGAPDARSVALAHVADRAAWSGGVSDDIDPGWCAIRIEADGRIVRAEQGIVADYEVVIATVHGRVATVVTNLFDAHRFEARYVSFRPWFEREA